MSYEESKLSSLLKKQDIDSLFLEATNYLCQTKSLFEEKEQLQQENEQLSREIDIWNKKYNEVFDKNKQLKDNWNNLKKWLEKELGDRINPNKDKWLTGVYDAYRETIDKMQEIEQGSNSNE